MTEKADRKADLWEEAVRKMIPLEPAKAFRTYTGGSRIERLHGNLPGKDSHFPEEWIMSVTVARNPGREELREGLSRIKGTDRYLKDLIEAYPEEMLGSSHFRKFGAQPGVLVKLIDSAERLTIQVHPDRETAKRLFHSSYGKTECWHILEVREDMPESPCIYLGFRAGITEEYWMEVFDRQDIPGMLACLHKFPVHPGDTFLIEGGMPHAIGAGCFLVEIQEPTDYTIRTERITPAGFPIADAQCHQGLGFKKMFECFHYTGLTRQEAYDRWHIQKHGTQVIRYEDTEMFRLEEYCIDGSLKMTSGDVFSGIYVLDGEGRLEKTQESSIGTDGQTPAENTVTKRTLETDGKRAADGQKTADSTKITRGDQFFIPADCAPFRIIGRLRLLRFYGPQSS